MKPPLRRLAPQRLSTQVVLAQVTILVLVLVAGFFAVQRDLGDKLNQQYEQRALAVAETVASQPSVLAAVTRGAPGGAAQQLAQAARRSSDALFVVITNARGIRYSHPDPAEIGKPVYLDEAPSTEPFRTGRAWTGIQAGTLGPVAAGKAPLYGAGGTLAGEVSVGFQSSTVAQTTANALPSLALYLLIVVGAGVLAALALSRRLKRQTFGLELGEIAALLTEREAMLHGIKEGLLGYDKHGRVLLANDTARRLLNLPPASIGRPVREMLPPGRLRDVVTGAVDGSDLPVVFGDRILVANRMPIKQVGWVVTFQDRTESEGLKRELDEAIGLTETLRAQSHEFANRLHTVVGLVELEHYDEAVQFVTDVSAARGELTDRLVTAITDPRLAALLLAKVSLAAERDVTLDVLPDSYVGQEIGNVSEVLTVVGNLVDNAIDAASLTPVDAASLTPVDAASLTPVDAASLAPVDRASLAAAGGGSRRVEVTLMAAAADLIIRVRDSGPGVPRHLRETIFSDGVTTKSSATGARRGLGLAIVSQVVTKRRGMISVGHEDGAVFTVVLPGCLLRERVPS